MFIAAGFAARVNARRLLAALATLFLTSFAVTVITADAADADPNATPTYEIKLDLGASALNADGTPTSAVLAKFGLADPAQRSYEYLDTSALDLNGQGWDVRVRHKAGDDVEYDYKKRFPVSNGDVDAALTTANQQGFDASDTNYDAEVDWSYSSQVLSFDDGKSESSKGLSGTALPSTAVSQAVKDIPGKLEDWQSKGWGKDTLSASRVHGPVTSTVWSGTWEGADASLEVLPVRAASGSGTQTVVELSFKTDDESSAASVRQDAIAATDAQGWLLHQDILKTDLILDRY